MKNQKNLILLFISIGAVFGLFFLFSSINENSISFSSKDSIIETEKIISNFENEHGFILQSKGGHILDDEKEFVNGQQSLRIITTGDGSYVSVKKSNIFPPIDFSEKILKFSLKINNVNYVDKFKIRISGDNFESYKTYWISKDNISPSVFHLRNAKWNPVTISLTQTEDFGSPDITEITDIEIMVKDKPNSRVVVWFDDMSLQNQQNEAVLSFTFDDGFLSQYSNANPILAKYNFSATAYILPNLVGQPNEMNLEQIKELQNVYNWDISPHTMRHMDLTNLRFESQYESELAKSKQFLVENGLQKGAEHFAYPFGNFDNDETMKLVKKYFKTARTVRGDIETLPVADQYRLRVQYIFNVTPPSEVSQRVQDAIENGDWLILVFHSIVKSNAKDYHGTYLESNFHKIVEDVKNQGIEVMPISEVYQAKFP